MTVKTTDASGYATFEVAGQSVGTATLIASVVGGTAQATVTVADSTPPPPSTNSDAHAGYGGATLGPDDTGNDLASRVSSLMSTYQPDYVVVLAGINSLYLPSGVDTFYTVAVSDMRIPGSTASYMQTYALNDDTLWGRAPPSAFRERAALVMGRYASPTAFTSTNPDYASELSWYPMNDPIRSMAWTRINFWNQIYLSDTYQAAHAEGFDHNTRVMFWDAEVWVKSISTGAWSKVVNTDTVLGSSWSPSFKVFGSDYDGDKCDYRIESSTGYPSVRLVEGATGPTGGADYWIWHGYAGLTAITGTDVADVVSVQKVSLVLHDPGGVDDRQYSRFLFAVGSDYYPASPLSSYPGVGVSRHKYVTAHWPAWEYRVMHTLTEAQCAAGGLPPALAGGFPPAPTNIARTIFLGSNSITADWFVLSNWEAPWNSTYVYPANWSWGADRWVAWDGSPNVVKTAQWIHDNPTAWYNQGTSPDTEDWVLDVAVSRGNKVWWACDFWTGVDSDITNVVDKFVTRYGRSSGGVVNNAVEIILPPNEPAFEGNDALYVAEWKREYGNIARAQRLIHAAAKNQNPALLVGGTEMLNLEDHILDQAETLWETDTGNGQPMKVYCDVITMHPYNHAGFSDAALNGMYDKWMDLRSRMTNHGIGSKPVWATEWMVTYDDNYVDIDTVKKYTWRMWATALAANVARFCFFEFGTDKLPWRFNNSEGVAARQWWEDQVTWFTSSPISQISIMDDGRILVKLINGDWRVQ